MSFSTITGQARVFVPVNKCFTGNPTAIEFKYEASRG